MPGLQDPGSIDLVAQDADGTTLLVIVEEHPWGTYADEDDLLVAKMNTYGAYATEQLHADYPQTSGSPTTVRIDCPTPPPAALAERLASARAHFGAHGIAVEVNVNPRLLPG